MPLHEVDFEFEAKRDALIAAIRNLARQHKVAHHPDVADLVMAIRKSPMRPHNVTLYKEDVLRRTDYIGIPRKELEPVIIMLYEG